MSAAPIAAPPADPARLLRPPPGLLGRAAVADAENRARGCSNPVRLVGGSVTHTVDRATGELGPFVSSYSSADELDGYTYVRCGDCRAHRCESCSREYKGDAWHLLTAGLAGGKDTPERVATHPATFATLTAPGIHLAFGTPSGGSAQDQSICVRQSASSRRRRAFGW